VFALARGCVFVRNRICSISWEEGVFAFEIGVAALEIGVAAFEKSVFALTDRDRVHYTEREGVFTFETGLSASEREVSARWKGACLS